MFIDKIFIYDNHFSLFNNSKKTLKSIEKYVKKEKLNSFSDNFAYLTKSEIVVNPKDKFQYKIFDLNIFYYKNGKSNENIESYSYDVDFVFAKNREKVKFIKDIYNIFKFIQQNSNGKLQDIKLKYDEILNSEKAKKLVEMIIDYEKQRKPSYGNVEGIYYVMKFYNKKNNEIDLEKILSYENEIQKDKLSENPSYNLLLSCLFLDTLKKFDFADFYNMDQTKREKMIKIVEDKITQEYNDVLKYLRKIKNIDAEKNFPYYLFYLKKDVQENLNVSNKEIVEFMRFYSKFFIYFNYKANALLEKTVELLTNENNKYLKEIKKHDNKNLKKYFFQIVDVINEELNDNNIIIFKTKNDEKRFYKFITTELFYKNEVNKLLKYYSKELNYFEILANFYKQLKNKEIKRYFENLE
ncbi:MAG: hypothetical protein QXS41_03140 [Candidatus Woesearchaeota archaeon]